MKSLKYQALFLDFYGTLVHEDDVAIAAITQKISDYSSNKNLTEEIALYWQSEFRQLFENSHGISFKMQRELETISIQKVFSHFKCENINLDVNELLFSHWIKPDMFEDTMQFLQQNVLPVCIVSNIDRSDIIQAINYHGMIFENIVTSEDAKSYKPRSEMFQMALEKMNLSPRQVLHIGDSLSSDILGAYNYGIDSFWLNRKKRIIPDNCSTYNGNTLIDVFEVL